MKGCANPIISEPESAVGSPSRDNSSKRPKSIIDTYERGALRGKGEFYDQERGGRDIEC